MEAIKEKTQAIKCSSCEPNCMRGPLRDASDINENMIDHMWGNWNWFIIWELGLNLSSLQEL